MSEEPLDPKTPDAREAWKLASNIFAARVSDDHGLYSQEITRAIQWCTTDNELLDERVGYLINAQAQLAVALGAFAQRALEIDDDLELLSVLDRHAQDRMGDDSQDT